MIRSDLEQLIADYIDGNRDQLAVRSLAQAIEKDGEARDTLARARYAECLLVQAGLASIDVDCVMRALPTAKGNDFQDRVWPR